ncbi:MAG: hypothetical protein SchgKO_01850 [Schleiferiaceae bacterium]
MDIVLLNMIPKLKGIIPLSLFALLMSCGSSYNLETVKPDEHISQWKFSPKEETDKVVLFLGDGVNQPDSIPKELIETFINKGYSVIGIEKYDSQKGYLRVINTDTRDLRIQTISDFLQSQTYSELIVYGRGEGGIIAPQIANNFRAKALIVSNTHLVSSKEYFESVLTCGCEYKDSLSAEMNLSSDQQWMEFMTAVQEKPNTGTAWRGRSSRQFASYWNYEALGYIQQFQGSSLVINNPKSPVYKKEYGLLSPLPKLTWTTREKENQAISKFLGNL